MKCMFGLSRSLAVLVLLLTAQVRAGEKGPISFGFFTGLYGGQSSEAITDYEQKKFGAALAAGIRAGVELDEIEFGIEYFELELQFSSFNTQLEESGVRFGKLRVFPLVCNVKMGSKFNSGEETRGIFFFTFGLGAIFSSFTKGPFLEDIEAEGVPTDVATDIGICLNAGAGVELFAVPGKLSLEFDLEYLLAGANTT